MNVIKMAVLSLLVVFSPSLLAVKCIGDSVAQFQATSLKGESFSLSDIKGKKRLFFQLFMSEEDDSVVDFDDFDEDEFDDLEEGYTFILVHLNTSCGSKPMVFLKNLSKDVLDNMEEELSDEEVEALSPRIHLVIASDRQVLEAFGISVFPIGYGFAPYVLDLDENNIITKIGGTEIF